MKKLLQYLSVVASLSLFSSSSCNGQAVSCQNFHQLIAKGEYKKVESQIKKGININCTINSGVTPLMSVAIYNQVHIVELLVKNGANIDAQTSAGWTAVLYAAEYGNLKAIQKLIDSKANLNLTLKGGENAILQATFRGHPEIAEELIKAGAKIGKPTRLGLTELIVAADKGYEKLVKILLAKTGGFNVNKKNFYGETALIRASLQGHKGVVELLLEKDANTNIKDDTGKSALNWARENKHTGIVEILSNFPEGESRISVLSPDKIHFALENDELDMFLAGEGVYCFPSRDFEEPNSYSIQDSWNHWIMPFVYEDEIEDFNYKFCKALIKILEEDPDKNKALYIATSNIENYYYEVDWYRNRLNRNVKIKPEINEVIPKIRQMLLDNKENLKKDKRWAGADWNAEGGGLWIPIIRNLKAINEKYNGPDFLEGIDIE